MFFPPYADAGGGVAGENPIIRVIELYVTPYDSWQGPDSRPEDVAVSDLTAGKVIGFAILVWETMTKVGSPWDLKQFRVKIRK